MARLLTLARNLLGLVLLGLLIGWLLYSLGVSALSRAAPAAGKPTGLAPAPQEGPRATAARELPLGTRLSIQNMYQLQFDGDHTLAGIAWLPQGQTVVTIDVGSGEVQAVLPMHDQATHDIDEIALTRSLLLWRELTPNPTGLGHIPHVYVLDFARGITYTLNAPLASYGNDLHAQDNLAVWQGNRGIYAYDLSARQLITTVVPNDVRFAFAAPRICSAEWVAYIALDGERGVAPPDVDLRVHSLLTGQDALIGQVTYSATAFAGHQHACDESWVAWIDPSYQVHAYNLVSRQTQVAGKLGQTLLVANGIIMSHLAYDLVTHTTADLRSQFPQGWYQVSWIYRGDRLFWLLNRPGSDEPHLFAASITRP